MRNSWPSLDGKWLQYRMRRLKPMSMAVHCFWFETSTLFKTRSSAGSAFATGAARSSAGISPQQQPFIPAHPSPPHSLPAPRVVALTAVRARSRMVARLASGEGAVVAARAVCDDTRVVHAGARESQLALVAVVTRRRCRKMTGVLAWCGRAVMAGGAVPAATPV